MVFTWDRELWGRAWHPIHPCTFRAQLNATDHRRQILRSQSKSAAVKSHGLLAFWAGPAWTLCTSPGSAAWPSWERSPQTSPGAWALALACTRELMGRLAPVDRTALNRWGSLQTLQHIFLPSAILASSPLDDLSPGSARVTPSLLWGLPGPSRGVLGDRGIKPDGSTHSRQPGF